jgi:EAL domain-containing protein (putative c-di-GMP-specific phosphodiesterase class I)
MTIAVNVADADLVDPKLLEQVQSELNHYELPTSALHLELSERATTAQAPEIQGRIRRMAAAGLRWHLDDFGTGHSNIQRLRGLPFSAVKLDRSMIKGLGRDAHSEQLLKPMIALARVLDLEVIAEGVERVEQLQTLTKLGCDIAQGHHLSPPRPAGAIEELLCAGAAKPQRARAEPRVDARLARHHR